jgi:hypothetical protein
MWPEFHTQSYRRHRPPQRGVIEWARPESERGDQNDSLPMRRDGLLEVTCWCERETVLVIAADVKAGRTESCGHAGCEAPEVTPDRSAGPIEEEYDR